MTARRWDFLAVSVLILLWLFFFWRLFTPIESDQASVTQGDFSGQFVAFAGYQYARFAEGQVPLWNPYNNGGLPFIADTQAAVFYPPRLLTIGLSNLAGGWTYHALELEMAVHVLLFSLLLYLLLRRMTLGLQGSVVGALISAVVGSYGGFFSGYPQLQLAILEAGIWLPLVILGIHEAFRRQPTRWPWLALSGFALGLSWMAGHPQTSWFLSYLAVAYLGYKVYDNKLRWTTFIGGTAAIALISVGMAAVQLLPGLEYLPQTARPEIGFDAKGNGFPFQDLLQLLFPGQLSYFSPLYIGVSTLALILLCLWRWDKMVEARFWIIVALLGLGLSFGANTAVFAALYNLLPGLRFFRGQERAAYLVASSLAILAGLTLVHLLNNPLSESKRERWTLYGLLAACASGVLLASSGWLTERPDQNLNVAVFSTIIALVTLLILTRLMNQQRPLRFAWLLAGLIVFELFSVTMGSNLDPVPPQEQISMNAPPLIEGVLADSGTAFRVDGFRGLQENYGSLYGLMDMRGISPLFLQGPFELIEPDKINPLAWELFAVRYVFSDWEQLPVDSDIVGAGEDHFGLVNVHQLSDPRPFAHLVYQTEVIPGDDFAHELLRDPNFDPRSTVILNTDPLLDLPQTAPEEGSATVTVFEPELIAIQVNTSENSVLSLSLPDYPGWQATVDGETADLMRAYGALSAVSISAGDHEVILRYDPLSFRIGAILSLVTWAGLAILGFWIVIRRGDRRGN